MINRRGLLRTRLALTALPMAMAKVTGRPLLGVIAHLSQKISPDQAIARVQAFAIPTCQVSVGPAPDIRLAGPLRAALDRYQVQATAIMTLGPGRMVWDFYSGPETIGIVPPATRAPAWMH